MMILKLFFIVNLFNIFDLFSQDTNPIYLKALNEHNNQLYSQSIDTLKSVDLALAPTSILQLKISNYLHLDQFQDAKAVYLAYYKKFPFSSLEPQFISLIKYALKNKLIDSFFSLIILDNNFFSNPTRIYHFILTLIQQNFTPLQVERSFYYLKKYVSVEILEQVFLTWFENIQASFNIKHLSIFENFFQKNFLLSIQDNLLKKILQHDILLHSPIMMNYIFTKNFSIPLAYLTHPYTSREMLAKIFLHLLQNMDSFPPTLGEKLVHLYITKEKDFYPLFVEILPQLLFSNQNTSKTFHSISNYIIQNMIIHKEFYQQFALLHKKLIRSLSLHSIPSSSSNQTFFWSYLDHLYLLDVDKDKLYYGELMDLFQNNYLQWNTTKWINRSFTYLQHKYSIESFTQLSPIKDVSLLQTQWEKFNASIQLLKPHNSWKAQKILWSYLDAITGKWENLGLLSHQPMAELPHQTIKLFESFSIEKEKIWPQLQKK